MEEKPRKRAREDAIGSGAKFLPLSLTGGHAEKPRTIESYRTGLHIDATVRSADGKQFSAHGPVLMAGSDYFAAAFTSGWADASGPHELSSVPGDALKACFDWIYTGACTVEDDSALDVLLNAAVFLQISTLQMTCLFDTGPSARIYHVFFPQCLSSVLHLLL